MAASFRSHGYPNPAHDQHGDLDWILACQFCSYKIADPKEIQQKAIPLEVISLINRAATTNRQHTIAQLITGAFFFACRSCKYLKVQRPEDKQTKIFTLNNIKF